MKHKTSFFGSLQFALILFIILVAICWAMSGCTVNRYYTVVLPVQKEIVYQKSIDPGFYIPRREGGITPYWGLENNLMEAYEVPGGWSIDTSAIIGISPIDTSISRFLDLSKIKYNEK